MATETDLNKAIMLRLGSRPDVRIARNNVGSAYNSDGQVVKFGLFGKGAADLIGIQRKVILPEDVGMAFGRFIAIESKKARRKGEHEDRQKNFHEMVRRMGGVAGFAMSVEEAEELLR